MKVPVLTCQRALGAPLRHTILRGTSEAVLTQTDFGRFGLTLSPVDDSSGGSHYAHVQPALSSPYNPEEDSMTIEVLAVFPDIDPGDLAEFRRRAAALLEISTREPGTLGYDWFFADAKAQCAVHEVYADSDAMLAHLEHVGALMGPLIELGGGIQSTIFGTMSAELAAKVAPFHATLYTRFQGK